MWPRPQLSDVPFSSPLPKASLKIPFRWAVGAARLPRFSGLRLTPLKAGIFLLIIGTFLFIRDAISRLSHPPISLELLKAMTLPQAPFQPPEQSQYRLPDIIDTFESYKFRAACNVSALDLHAPFSPLCHDRHQLLRAMSSGGRIGHDAPYMPRGCDMRWFTTEEVCEILGRFDKVILIGDSMLRHIIGSINILIRKDIGYGAVTDWNFSQQERKDCFCNEQFNVKTCSVQGIYKTSDVLLNDPESLTCRNAINVVMEEIVRFPIPEDEINRLRGSVGRETSRQKAVILGHGLWSNLDVQQSVKWLDTIIQVIKSTTGTTWHSLFITPNAAGRKKPDEWIISQGNKALMLFEESLSVEAGKRGIEHLGTWNMSIQSNKYDGVHLDMKGNLIKAMMVINWLNLLEV